ncbi:hypothetical protein BVX97_04395 [bacterium E08(2017)]|nr:hypothetical protein BVX97_04395 [bacterium E08(2017)]
MTGRNAICVAYTLFLLFGLNLFADIAGPAGVYVISNTKEDLSEPGKFNLPYITGVSLRMPWADMQTYDDISETYVYDFSRIDRFIDELTAVGQKMTLELLIGKPDQSVLDHTNIVTWVNPRDGSEQPVPWDRNALDAYLDLMTNLSAHVVPGSGVPLNENPTLVTVSAPIPGLSGVREVSGTLVAHPDYDRQTFVDAIVEGVAMSRDAFPNKHGFLAFFAMDDANVAQPLDRDIFDALQAAFNGEGQRSLGYFQETLSDTGPNAAAPMGSFLKEASDSTYIVFQALKPWIAQDEPAVESGTPVVGFWNAWENFGATYVELYGADATNQINAQDLTDWNRFFHIVTAFEREEVTMSLGPQSASALNLEWTSDPEGRYLIRQSTDLMDWTTGSQEVYTNTAVLNPTENRQFFKVEPLAPSSSGD